MARQFQVKFDKRDIKAFKRAIKRNPAMVKMYANDFFVEAMAAYNRKIIRNPWEIGGTPGGAPVDTGNLRDTHKRTITPWEARIEPTTDYAPFVHEGTSRMQARPWLEYAFESARPEVNRKADEFLKKVVNKLAE